MSLHITHSGVKQRFQTVFKPQCFCRERLELNESNLQWPKWLLIIDEKTVTRHTWKNLNNWQRQELKLSLLPLSPLQKSGKSLAVYVWVKVTGSFHTSSIEMLKLL